MQNIIKYHENILNYLLEKHAEDKNFMFVPRKNNYKGRLDEGYWFLGNSNYLGLSFWDASDTVSRIHSIAFIVDIGSQKPLFYLEISYKDSIKKEKYFDTMSEYFENNNVVSLKVFNGLKRRRYYYDGTDTISNLESFITNIKPHIDKYIRNNPIEEVSLVRKDSFDKWMRNLNEYRNKLNKIATDKLARICWNDNGWRMPSGASGKSKTDIAYEKISGFGHEEWIFDRTRIIDGYHYAFLQPLNLKGNKHVGRFYNISLFTKHIDGTNFYVGMIKNVECISKQESSRIFYAYKNNNWLDDMSKELKQVKADCKEFENTSPEIFVNIRFKFEDLIELSDLQVISDKDNNISSYHFKLLDNTSDIIIETVEVTERAPDKKKGTANHTRSLNQGTIEVNPYHNKIQNALVIALEKDSKYENIFLERDYVDVKALTNSGEWHYFEVKTSVPKKTIREALGQILEYAYYPDFERADKLYIVSTDQPDKEVQDYLKMLRNKFRIPVYYLSVDMDKEMISKEY